MAAPTLIDAKAQLNISGSGQDNEVQFYLNAAQRLVERRVGAFTVTSATETVTAATNILLTNRPVQSVTGLTPVLKGQPSFQVADLVVDSRAGIVYHQAGLPMRGVWSVSYTHGLTDVPDNVSLATLIVLQHLWSTQRGGSRRPGQTDPEMLTATTGAGYAMPWMALETLAPDDLWQGVA